MTIDRAIAALEALRDACPDQAGVTMAAARAAYQQAIDAVRQAAGEPSPLSDEDYRMISYFSREYHDPERWYGWNKVDAAVAKHEPSFHKAWMEYKLAKAIFKKAIEDLPDR